MAELATSYMRPTDGGHIVYNFVHLNDGNAYHNSQGTFIALAGGLYEFSTGYTAHLGKHTRTNINVTHSGSPTEYLFLDWLETGSSSQSFGRRMSLVRGNIRYWKCINSSRIDAYILFWICNTSRLINLFFENGNDFFMKRMAFFIPI